MKNTLLFTVFTALVAAQNITDLPECSLICLASTVTGLGCGLTDFACSCQTASQLTPIVTPCVQASCPNVADQSETIKVISGICAAAGFPIEAHVPPASSAAPEPTPEPTTSETPVETQHGATEALDYPKHPTTSEFASEYPATTHVTNDVPSPLSSVSLPPDFIPLPSFVDTVILSHTTSKASHVASVLPPYPIGTPVPSESTLSGTGAVSKTSSRLPEFTGGASAGRIPGAVVGVVGVVALVL